jgi:predicted transcriptional regulator of viral defense system
MNGSDARAAVAANDLSDWLIAHGQHFVTSDAVAKILGVPKDQATTMIARQKARGRIFSPTRGAYVPIPPEYRNWGAVPANHFVDALMQHLGHPYYVAFLTAAEIHDAAHQRPQAFQVITDVQVRDRSFERVRLEFARDLSVARRSVDVVNTPTGTMRVASPEVTVLDLVAWPRHGGGLSNVATVIGDLLVDRKLREPALLEAAWTYPNAVVQRAGWLLDKMGEEVDAQIDTGKLASLSKERRRIPARLDPADKRSGLLDKKWNLLVNADIEPDL